MLCIFQKFKDHSGAGFFYLFFFYLQIHVTISLNLGKGLPLYEKDIRFRYEGIVKRNK